MVVSDAARLDELVRSSPLPVLVDLWAEWCGPCHALARSLEEIAVARAGSLVVASVDGPGLPRTVVGCRSPSPDR